MSLVETTYSTIADADAAFNLKEDMKAQGWSVAISSDGTTYNGSGDQITTSGSGAGGIDNADVYFLLRQSGAPDWLFVRGADSQTWTISYSVSAGFSGGNATTPPTAGDSWIAFSGGSYQLFPSASLDTVTIEVEDAAPYRWAIRSTDSSFNDTYVASVGDVTEPLFLFSLNYTGGVFFAASDAAAWDDVVAMLSISAGGGTGPAPVIDNWSPAAGPVSRTDAITFDVTSSDGFSAIFVWAVLGDSISTVVIYDGANFCGEVDANSTVTGTTTKSFSIVYDGDGWATDYDLYVRAVTSLGGTATDVQSYTLTDPPDPPDSGAPTVTLVSPPVGSRLQRGTPIVIDVTDASGLATVCMWAEYEGGFPDDLVHNGERFSAQCREGSTREAITNGYRYTLRRAGGWPAAPTIFVRPVDTLGNTP